MLNCDNCFTNKLHCPTKPCKLHMRVLDMSKWTLNTDCRILSLADYFIVMKITIPTILLIALCVFFYTKWRRHPVEDKPKLPTALPMLSRNMTLEELQQYDGTGVDKRILIGLNGNIYDVTAGRQKYGPGMPFEMFAGQNLTFRDWEKIISFAYYKVGKVITTKVKSRILDTESTSQESLNAIANKFLRSRPYYRRKMNRHGLCYNTKEELRPLTFDDDVYDLDSDDSHILNNCVDKRISTTVETIKYTRLLNETEV
ncbi:membrane steroid-binding protein 2-like [Teleopsis dalmanni]|uniref:membrane steroid-binding protein 2-like n=1 Tax=Teleopsis dalmanni TaxID=139649 RepID=UPI0018CDCB85|nr:membrane steroid-binding protein 2-like [Teleopsis dalmanni]